MRIDHVVLATRDIEATADRLLRDHGLGAMPGGDHVDWGTGNSIVPAGTAYLEVMGIRDLEKARTTPVGQWVLSLTAEGQRLAAVCVSSDDLDGVSARLGLTAAPARRVRPDGTTVSWRMAGDERAMAEVFRSSSAGTVSPAASVRRSKAWLQTASPACNSAATRTGCATGWATTYPAWSWSGRAGLSLGHTRDQRWPSGAALNRRFSRLRTGALVETDAMAVTPADIIEAIVDELVIGDVASDAPEVEVSRTGPGSLLLDYGHQGRFRLTVTSDP